MPSSFFLFSTSLSNIRSFAKPHPPPAAMPPSHLRKLPPIARPLPVEQISPTKPPPCRCFHSIRPNAPAPDKSARHTHIVSAVLFYIPFAPAIPHKLRIVATSSAARLLPL